ncbi:MAG: arylsulfatase [Pirellula sp.]
MTQRLFLLALLVYLPSAFCADTQPNILVILADDLGYSDLGCYGGEIQTPHIDRLAAKGLRFTQFYNSARCCPSRAALMTGLYPTQAGIGDFTSAVPDDKRGPGYLGRLNGNCATIAELLEPAGYGCYYVGKWHMHSQTGPIDRGFHQFYGYTRGHSHDQFDRDYYVRLPHGTPKEINPPLEQYYATDVFNEYALEFIRQGQAREKPWFVFLAHSSPHFPIQAPAGRVAKYQALYRRGWDRLREERFKRMKSIGLIDDPAWQLTERSIVPVDDDKVANGFSGQSNPPWEALAVDRRNDLAQRMAVYAAMVESIDTGVGKILEHLHKTGEFEKTLIIFLSDNGACYEWGPFGFDGESRKGINKLHQESQLEQVGARDSHQSYGSAWANLSNTPLRSYKHFTYEGGIINPCVVHFPWKDKSGWVHRPAHMIDIVPTILEAAGVDYPTRDEQPDLHRPEGLSLWKIADDTQATQERILGFDHQGAHALRQGDWKIVWTKRSAEPIRWELFNLSLDRCETTDRSQDHKDIVERMVGQWEAWANRVGVDWQRDW